MKISATELDLLRAKNQAPQFKIEIYDSDGLIQTLTDIENFSVSLGEDAFVRRTFRLAVNNKNQKHTFDITARDDNLFWYDKTIKIYAKVGD